MRRSILYLFFIAFIVVNIPVLSAAVSYPIFLNTAVLNFIWKLLIFVLILGLNYLYWFKNIKFFNYRQVAKLQVDSQYNYISFFFSLLFPTLLSLYLCLVIQGLLSYSVIWFATASRLEMARITDVNCVRTKGNGMRMKIEILDESTISRTISTSADYCTTEYDFYKINGLPIKLLERTSWLGKVVDSNNLNELLSTTRIKSAYIKEVYK